MNRGEGVPVNVDWLIIGGGIHGVHLAARLLGQVSVEASRLRIIDPGDRLLERWRTCTDLTGMPHLRSPSVHHLDVEAHALLRFAGKRRKRKPGLFAHPYDRPALSFFNAHCERVIDTFGLSDLHIKDRAVHCSVDCEGVVVQLSGGATITAQQVILAMGAGEQPEWPDWAPRQHARVQHVFAPGFDAWPTSLETVVVAGGGISAGQVALRLLDEGHDVHLVSRHALRKHQFDSDQGWLGPKLMVGFNRERNYDRRRAIISKARHKGSVPPDIWRALDYAIKGGRLHWHEYAVDQLDVHPDKMTLQLSGAGVLEAHRVLLATGFAANRPGGAMVDRLVASAALPCASCGYPIVDKALRWHPRIFVSGPLAELELGPVSRNIAGARRAGDRLVQWIRTTQSSRSKEGTSTPLSAYLQPADGP